MSIARLSFAALVVDALVLLILAGNLPAFSSAYAVPMATAGLLFSANGLGFIVAVPLSGALSERHGKRTVAAVSAAVLAAALFLFACSHSLGIGLAAGALAGAGAGSVESGVTALLPELYPGREGFANNFAQAFFSLGATIGPPLLLLSWPGWRLRLALCGLAFLALALGLWRGRAGDREGGSGGGGALSSAAALVAILRAPGVLVPAVALVLYTGVEVAVWGWLFAVVTRPGGAGPAWAVADLSGFWAAMGVGRLLFAHLSERVHLALLVAVAATAAIPALLCTLLLRSPAAALVAVICCGLVLSGIWPSLVALGQKAQGGSAMLASAMVAAGGVGSLAVPAAFGFAAARLGLGVAAGGLAALLAVVALLPAGAWRPARMAHDG